MKITKIIPDRNGKNYSIADTAELKNSFEFYDAITARVIRVQLRNCVTDEKSCNFLKR